MSREYDTFCKFCFILVAFNDHSLSFYSVKLIYYQYISDHRVHTTPGNIDSTVAILAQGNHRFETSAQPLFFLLRFKSHHNFFFELGSECVAQGGDAAKI